MINLNSKLPNAGTSIFAVMSKMAADFNAINLSQGFPDFNCDDELLDLVNHYQREGYNQYAPMPGVPVLRDQISKKIKKMYGRYYNPETEITVTSGATQGLFTAITAVINKGDEAIVFEPAYDSYIPAITLNGGIPITISLKGDNFNYDWNEVKSKITVRTKLIIINSPHNPSGSLISKDDIDQLIKIVNGTEILIISDEVYEHIVFDDEKHLSFSTYDELANRSFVLSSFGKTYHTTGWKMGYCAAPENLTKEFRKVHQFAVFSSNTPIQYAYADYMKKEDKYLNLGKFYQSKRDIFAEAVKDSKFKVLNCFGTYFQLLDYSNVSELPEREFAELLAKEHGLAVIPLSPFYLNEDQNSLIRICFAKDEKVLKDAAKILRRM